MMATETPCTPNYSHTKKKDLDEEFKRSDFSVEKSRDDKNVVYEMTPSSTRKRQRRIIDSDDEDGIDRKTSIAVVGSDSVENDETTSSEMVRSSSKKKSRVVYRSDSEDDGEDTPGFNALKGRATAVRRFKKNLNEAFGKNEVEDDQSTDSSDSEGDGSISESDSSFVGEIGGTSENRRSTRNSTSGKVLSMDYCCTASTEKMKREKAIEALKKSRERQAGELPEKSSLDNNYDNEGSVLPKLCKNNSIDLTFEEEQEEESGSDMDDFIVEDSQSQEVPVFAKPELEEAYKRFVQMILSSILDRDFLSSLQDEQDPYFDQVKDTIDKVIESKKNLVGSTAWVQFKEMLENCSVLESEPLPTIKKTTCEACRRNPRNLTERMIFYSADYNGVKVLPSEMEFSVGCFCAERGSLYHDLHQHHFHLTQSCKEKINKVREAMGIESDQNIVECCINDEEWLNVLFTTFQALLNKADEWAVDGKKRKHMKAHCASFH